MSLHLHSRGLAVRVFLTCWLVFALHFATNTVREIYPAVSLGDRLSFDVSEYLDLHPDIFEIPGRGAFINNNPGASILGAIPYALLRPVVDGIVARVQRARASSAEPPPDYDTIYPMAREFHRKAYQRGLDVKFGLSAGVLQAFLMAPLSALSVVVMFRILLALTSSIRAAVLLALLYAFATPVFFRTGQLNQNLLVGHFALFAFALLWRPWDHPFHPKRPSFLLAGLLSGWAVVLDYSGLVVLLFVGLYSVVRRAALPQDVKSRTDMLRFASGALLSLTVLMGYQWRSFGNPFYPAQFYMPAATFTHLGYRGMGWPHLDLLWQTAFDMRFGLFISAPLLLLALYVPAWLHGRARLPGGRETGWILLFSLAFFLFTAANQYSRMQFNSGVRHVVPVIPFLFLVAAGVLVRMPTALSLIVGILTTYWSWSLAMYRDVEQGLGVFESIIHVTLEGFRLPWLMTLEHMGYVSNGASPLPLFLLAGAILWTLWNARLPLRRTPGPAVPRVMDCCDAHFGQRKEDSAS